MGLAARRLRLGRPLGEPRYLERSLAVGHREQRVGEGPTPEGGHAVDRGRGGRRVEQHPVITRQRECDVGPREGEHGDRVHDGARFRRLGTQEFAARRRVEEQRPHGDRGAALPHRVFHRLDLAADDTGGYARGAVW